MQTQELLSRHGQPVYDISGQQIGKIEDIYIDDETQQPEWVSIDAGGMFRSKHYLAPIEGAEFQGDGLKVAYSKDQVSSAPSFTADEISIDEEQELYEHYGLRQLMARQGRAEPGLAQGQARQSRSEAPSAEARARDNLSGAPSRSREDISSRSREDISGARSRSREDLSDEDLSDMESRQRDEFSTAETESDIRSEIPGSESSNPEVVAHEERLNVGTRQAAAGHARLHKYVETRPVEEQVRTRQETAHVERQEINQPASDAEFREEDVEMELSREEPVVSKETVARERVSLRKDVEEGTETVRDELRSERVEAEGDFTEGDYTEDEYTEGDFDDASDVDDNDDRPLRQF